MKTILIKKYDTLDLMQDENKWWSCSPNQKSEVLKQLIVARLKHNKLYYNRTSYNFEDIVQEILMVMWMKVNDKKKYESKNIQLGAWITMQYKSARSLVHYRVNQSKQNQYENQVLHTLDECFKEGKDGSLTTKGDLYSNSSKYKIQAIWKKKRKRKKK